jgi:hypothetical protein
MSPRTPEEECARDTADAIHLDPETDMLVKKATQLLASLFQVAFQSNRTWYSVADPGSGAFF